MSDREDYKVYVGNLNYSVTEDEVRDHFEEYGRVEEGKSLEIFVTLDHVAPFWLCFNVEKVA